MFGRPTITLGIGPHSSSEIVTVVLLKAYYVPFLLYGLESVSCLIVSYSLSISVSTKLSIKFSVSVMLHV